MKHHLSVLILAAGKGTRMKSSLPKLLHTVCEVPIILRVLRTVLQLSPESVGVVIGHRGKEVIKTIKEKGHELSPNINPLKKLKFIWQKTAKGSGHAVQVSSHWIKKKLGRENNSHSSSLLILCGDTPLISKETLQSLVFYHLQQKNSLTLYTMNLSQPFGYGRIARDSDGKIKKIVEEQDASKKEREICEVNTGIYCFDAKKLVELLPKLKNNNSKGEYYLTDLIEFFYQNKYNVGSLQINSQANRSLKVSRSETPPHKVHCEALGINTREDLSMAEELFQRQILKRWMDAGVTILNPSHTYVGEKVQIGRDTVLLPGTMILGKTEIGNGCKIGPNTLIEDSKVGNNSVIRSSFVYGSTIGEEVQVGPFSHLRTGTKVERGARIGNFTEIKNSEIGRETKCSHLSYIGDSTIGDAVNIGAGAITCNFDGKNKHKTKVGSKSFIGSNVNLIAPIQIGMGTIIGAGSTITKNVPQNSLAIERAPQVIKENWIKKKKEKTTTHGEL